jgi:hypothetical protein
MKKILLLMILTVAFAGAAAYALAPENSGTINITVLDENGALVPDAPIYIYGEHKTRFVGGKEIPGTTTLSMPSGSYRISSALVKKTGDYLDRFASHEAHVEVVPGDNAVIVLTLRPLEDPLARANITDLSSRVGLPSELARSLN